VLPRLMVGYCRYWGGGGGGSVEVVVVLLLLRRRRYCHEGVLLLRDVLLLAVWCSVAAGCVTTANKRVPLLVVNVQKKGSHIVGG